MFLGHSVQDPMQTRAREADQLLTQASSEKLPLQQLGTDATHSQTTCREQETLEHLALNGMSYQIPPFSGLREPQGREDEKSVDIKKTRSSK